MDYEHKITVRMNDDVKKKLSELAATTGQSINKTIVNLVVKSSSENEIKGYVIHLINQVNALTKSAVKQEAALRSLIETLRR